MRSSVRGPGVRASCRNLEGRLCVVGNRRAECQGGAMKNAKEKARGLVPAENSLPTRIGTGAEAKSDQP